MTEFLTVCARRSLSGLSRARKLAALRQYYLYLIDNEVSIKAPTSGVETPKKEYNTRSFLVPHEYHSVLSAAGGNTRDYAIFQVFGWLGHANLNTTQVYVHLAKQPAGKMMEQTSL